MSTHTVTTSLRSFKDELELDQLWPRTSMIRTRQLTTFLTGVGALTLGAGSVFHLPLAYQAITGATLLFAGLACKQWLVTCYHNTAYYRGLSSYISSDNFDQATITYDLAMTLYRNEHDITKAFLTSPFGIHMCADVGLPAQKVADFLASKRIILSAHSLTLEKSRATTLVDLVALITTYDHDFCRFVIQEDSTPDIVLESCKRIMSLEYEKKRSERFWGRDILSKRLSLGRRLAKRTTALPHSTVCTSPASATHSNLTPLITTMTRVLAASREANILLVTKDTTSAQHIVGQLAHTYETGEALNAIVGHEFLAIDVSSFEHSTSSPDDIEGMLQSLFMAAVQKGNVTLVLYDALTSIRYFTKQGVSFDSLCEEYLGHSGLHLILTATQSEIPTLTHDFHHLTTRCEEVSATLFETDIDVLTQTEGLLAQAMTGQSRAYKAVITALRRNHTMQAEDNKPRGSFLFLGPRGVGKSETAQALATHYLHNKDAFLFIDVHEYQTADSLSRLIGTATESGVLTHALTNTTSLVIYIPEFEKAHPIVQEVFFEALSTGRYTNGNKDDVSVCECLIIATSDVASDLIAKTTLQRQKVPALDSMIMLHIKKHCLPGYELLNRFNDIIIFDALATTEEISIAHHQVALLTKKLEGRGFGLQVEDEAIESLLARTHHITQEATSWRSHFTKMLEGIIAVRIIRGEVKPGDTIIITTNDLHNS